MELLIGWYDDKSSSSKSYVQLNQVTLIDIMNPMLLVSDTGSMFINNPSII